MRCRYQEVRAMCIIMINKDRGRLIITRRAGWGRSLVRSGLCRQEWEMVEMSYQDLTLKCGEVLVIDIEGDDQDWWCLYYNLHD